MPLTSTDWGEAGPDVLWFDDWPPLYALATCAVTFVFGLLIGHQAGLRWLGWIFLIAAVPIPLIRIRIHLDFALRTWRYQGGVWPFIKTRVGGFDQLYGIEITKTSGGTQSPPRYIARLHWQPNLIGKRELYESDSFAHVARPALVLSQAIGIPIVLDHDMAVFYGGQLENLRSGVAYDPPVGFST